MNKSDFDYKPETDDLPTKYSVWIVLAALALAVYLSQILV